MNRALLEIVVVSEFDTIVEPDCIGELEWEILVDLVVKIVFVRIPECDPEEETLRDLDGELVVLEDAVPRILLVGVLEFDELPELLVLPDGDLLGLLVIIDETEEEAESDGEGLDDIESV